MKNSFSRFVFVALLSASAGIAFAGNSYKPQIAGGANQVSVKTGTTVGQGVEYVHSNGRNQYGEVFDNGGKTVTDKGVVPGTHDRPYVGLDGIEYTPIPGRKEEKERNEKDSTVVTKRLDSYAKPSVSSYVMRDDKVDGSNVYCAPTTVTMLDPDSKIETQEISEICRTYDLSGVNGTTDNAGFDSVDAAVLAAAQSAQDNQCQWTRTKSEIGIAKKGFEVSIGGYKLGEKYYYGDAAWFADDGLASHAPGGAYRLFTGLVDFQKGGRVGLYVPYSPEYGIWSTDRFFFRCVICIVRKTGRFLHT